MIKTLKKLWILQFPVVGLEPLPPNRYLRSANLSELHLQLSRWPWATVVATCILLLGNKHLWY